MTDPIADLLTRVRNGQMVRKGTVLVPYSKLKEELLKVLKKSALIEDYKLNEIKQGFKEIVVTLKLGQQLTLRRVSRPGQRIYVSVGEIKPVLNGFGVAILSTSKGLMTGLEAKKQKLGGELLCEVY